MADSDRVTGAVKSTFGKVDKQFGKAASDATDAARGAGFCGIAGHVAHRRVELGQSDAKFGCFGHDAMVPRAKANGNRQL